MGRLFDPPATPTSGAKQGQGSDRRAPIRLGDRPARVRIGDETWREFRMSVIGDVSVAEYLGRMVEGEVSRNRARVLQEGRVTDAELIAGVKRCDSLGYVDCNKVANCGGVMLDIGMWSTSTVAPRLSLMRRRSTQRVAGPVAVRPLIGITTSEVRVAPRLPHTPQADPPRPEMALGLSYSRAIVAAGGVPVVLPPLDIDGIASLLGQLGGVCLSGGPDLDPAAYGATAQPQLGPTWPQLDAYELALARHADASGVPLLAICRGMQTLNVGRGGTLHQHVDGHRQESPCERPTQRVDVAPDSRLRTLVTGQRLEVNSFHHQAVADLGHGLRPVAWAPDGVIEAVEGAGPRFVVGIQWHAEGLIARAEQLALFTAFVDAAREPRSGLHVRAA